MNREKAETIFAKYLNAEDVTDEELSDAILLAIKDMHKMAEIEEVVM